MPLIELFDIAAILILIPICLGVVTFGVRVTLLKRRTRIKKLEFNRSMTSWVLLVTGLLLMAVAIYLWYFQNTWPALVLYACNLTFGSNHIDSWQQYRILEARSVQSGQPAH
jgi:hypothetical protein